MEKTYSTIVMLIAVFSVGGYFLNQQAMAGVTVGSTEATATATIDPTCSLASGAFNFGTLDTITDAAGSAEITVTMANSAASNQASSVAVLGAGWLDAGTSALNIMNVGNTQFDDDNIASAGTYTPLTGTAQALIIVQPNTSPDTFWIVLAVLNGAQGTGFTENIEQVITLDFACVASTP